MKIERPVLLKTDLKNGPPFLQQDSAESDVV